MKETGKGHINECTVLMNRTTGKIIECTRIDPFKVKDMYFVTPKCTPKGYAKEYTYSANDYALIDITCDLDGYEREFVPYVKDVPCDESAATTLSVKDALSEYDKAIKDATAKFALSCVTGNNYRNLQLVSEQALNHDVLVERMGVEQISNNILRKQKSI